MWPVSAKFKDSVIVPHDRVASATFTDLVTNTSTALDVVEGSVTEDGTSSKVRRSLSLTLPNEPSTWELLDTPAGEITVVSTMLYVDHTTEDVPLGVFRLDQDQMGYAAGGQLSLSCPDRWQVIARSRLPFGARSSVASNPVWEEIQRLVEGAFPGTSFPGWAQLDTSASQKTGYLLWDDGDREAALAGDNGLVTANGLELFFDRQGMAVLRKLPTVTAATLPVATIAAGASGSMIDANRTRDRSQFFNAIEVSTNLSDVTFLPVTVANTDHSDPLSIYGPLGQVAEQWSGPFRSSVQAQAAGRARLVLRLQNAETPAVSQIPNVALDAWDAVEIVYPPSDPSLPPAGTVRAIATISHPLSLDGAQDIQSRSTIANVS